MRFGTFRTAYRVATRHFGSNVAYRQYYQAPRTVTAMMPYLCTRTNPVTLRLEDQAADGSSNVKQLFSTSMSGSALLSPVSELSSLETGAFALFVWGVVHRTVCYVRVASRSKGRISMHDKINATYQVRMRPFLWPSSAASARKRSVEYLCRLISWH
uniref:Uncharacterized protein n=1 Tax=Neospora caninum (strain Liverpool) TaxID=572307 RepID=A0A0F7UD78_NEOCL|nr:TPA: hypothetical protein BN1204_036240 [Neospora caninum Liverpool]